MGRWGQFLNSAGYDMAEDDKPCEGTLAVNFQEITDTFSSLKPVAVKVTTIDDFVALVKPSVNDIFLKYFEFPNSRLYKPEDMGFLIQHVMDCINNIMPAHILYRSVSVEGQWRFYPKDNNGQFKTPKPS